MGKFTFLTFVISLVLYGDRMDFVSDEEFFAQEVVGEDEYFSGDPAIRERSDKEDHSVRIIDVDPIGNKRPIAIRDGVDKAFYSDGKLRYEIGYRNGLKDGMEKIFYSDGKLRSETGYRDGRKDGMEKLFYSDGKLRSETSYRDGRKDGMEKLFYYDGRIRSEIIYRNGRVERVIFKN
jgi:hypothetical protein